MPYQRPTAAPYALTVLVCLGMGACLPHWREGRATEATPVVAEGRLVQFAVTDSGVPDVLNSRFGVPITVHGHTILLMADLGADATVLTGRAFDSIGVRSMFANATRVVTLLRGDGRTP